MIAYVLPTRNRPERLARTLDALGALGAHAHVGGAEVIVVDNASDPPARVPARLASGVPVRLVRREGNEGAAGRNVAVAAADPACDWVVMLDDDSHPMDAGCLRVLALAPPDVGAVAADIRLASGWRESGGLPEVFVGCGVAIRRRLFEDLGGYDPSFNYYAEEYDLAARMLLAGFRVVFDPWFRVLHHKDALRRDMDLITARLVRNNGWVIQRYCPGPLRRDELRRARRRYRWIGRKENGLRGYAQGLVELRRTIRAQRRTPMSPALYDRFTGLAHARAGLAAAWGERRFDTAAIVDEGRNAWAVRQALVDLGVRVVDADQAPDAVVIGTLSPGPMLDAFEKRVARRLPGDPRVLMPWTPVQERWAWRVRDALTGGAAPAGVSAA